ncbi:hypothetical protein KKB40_00440 [Patescibacteria group bacterium]|nr:hypothetical protein [Patescibacteria group bacterium]
MNIFKRLFFVIILFIFSFLILLNNSRVVLAGSYHELNLPEQRINPDHIVYPAKRLWEKFREKTIRNHESKVSYYESLIEVRLSELGYIVKDRNIGQTQKAGERFSYFSGTLTEYLLEKEGVDEDKKRLKEKFTNYKVPLEELRDEFPANSSDWMMISYCIDSLDEYSSKLSE